MVSLSKEITISASPDLVWKVAGDFSDIAQWHPLIEKVKMTERTLSYSYLI